MSVLNPLKQLVATVLVTAHDLLAGWHVPPESVWPLSVVALVILVRLAVLPLAIPAVRSARAAGRARPALLALGTLPRGAGPEEVRAHLEQRREINRAHGVTSLGMLLPLLQLPVFFALYGVLADIGAGRTGGALTATVIASATSGGILGIGLADRWWPLWATHPLAASAVGALAVVAGALTWATQRFVTPLNSFPPEGPMAQVLGILPTVAFVGVLVSATFVPAGVVLYWAVSNLVTLLQQAAVARWLPTPGTAADSARASRREPSRGRARGGPTNGT